MPESSAGIWAKRLCGGNSLERGIRVQSLEAPASATLHGRRHHMKYTTDVMKALLLAAPLVLGACSDNSAGDAARDAGDAVGDAVDNAGDATGDALDRAGDAAGDAADSVQDKASDATDSAGDALDDARDAAGNALDKAGDAASDAAGAVQDKVNGN